MIRVLSDDYHLHLVKRTQVEGIEDEFTGRITRGAQVFRAHELCEVDEILLFEFLAEMVLPRLFNVYVHDNMQI